MICLTFDTDYMTPDWMDRFLAEMAPPGQGTFFMWAPFPGQDWRGHAHEPHPHFEHLQDIPKQLRDFSDKLELAQPNGFRAHSCVTSHMIAIAAKQLGVRYVSMASPIHEAGLKPYRHPWGVWEMPIYYMDNMDFCMTVNWPSLNHKPFDKAIIDRALDEDGLFVFDFHPLHVALNTPNFDAYQKVKHQLINDKVSPWDLRFDEYGAGDFYRDVCNAMRERGVESVSLDAALDAFEAKGEGALKAA